MNDQNENTPEVKEEVSNVEAPVEEVAVVEPEVSQELPVEAPEVEEVSEEKVEETVEENPEEVVVPSEYNCLVCSGTGLKDSYHLCENCKGTGKI